MGDWATERAGALLQELSEPQFEEDERAAIIVALRDAREAIVARLREPTEAMVDAFSDEMERQRTVRGWPLYPKPPFHEWAEDEKKATRAAFAALADVLDPSPPPGETPRENE